MAKRKRKGAGEGTGEEGERMDLGSLPAAVAAVSKQQVRILARTLKLSARHRVPAFPKRPTENVTICSLTRPFPPPQGRDAGERTRPRPRAAQAELTPRGYSCDEEENGRRPDNNATKDCTETGRDAQVSPRPLPYPPPAKKKSFALPRRVLTPCLARPPCFLKSPLVGARLDVEGANIGETEKPKA